MKRRQFVSRSALLAGGLGLAGPGAMGSFHQAAATGNSIPKWKGFNVQDFFSPHPGYLHRGTTDEELKWMADWGFDFVRIPMAYPAYLDMDRRRDIHPDEVYKLSEKALERIDDLVFRIHKHGMHASLNLHRAPGYCINAGFHEPFNLWKDQEAQEAFYWHWAMWARRFKSISRDRISFDLLNEPAWIEDMNNQYSSKTMVPGDLYAQIAQKAAEVIWKENPEHLVIADGNQVGSKVIPELSHLPIAQSCRGYFPHIISHYKADWVFKAEQMDKLPPLKYPGQVGDQYLGREMLEEFYAPWIKLLQSGVGVHCGECGCYNQTPHQVFLDWFADVLDILGSHGIGFALWSFRGNFGILDSGRKDVDYVDWYGHKLDKKLLDLLKGA